MRLDAGSVELVAYYVAPTYITPRIPWRIDPNVEARCMSLAEHLNHVFYMESEDYARHGSSMSTVLFQGTVDSHRNLAVLYRILVNARPPGGRIPGP